MPEPGTLSRERPARQSPDFRPAIHTHPETVDNSVKNLRPEKRNAAPGKRYFGKNRSLKNIIDVNQ
jgi:hypothetical protein